MSVFYIMASGAYTLEDLGDFSWQSLSYGIMLLYHFILLQIIGLVFFITALKGLL